ncbi:hypothetical protein D3C80_1868020 [compost metagenome]
MREGSSGQRVRHHGGHGQRNRNPYTGTDDGIAVGRQQIRMRQYLLVGHQRRVQREPIELHSQRIRRCAEGQGNDIQQRIKRG